MQDYTSEMQQIYKINKNYNSSLYFLAFIKIFPRQ